MKAALYHQFAGPLTIEQVDDPSPAADGAVIRVEATGLCRSDWHGWQGHDPDITALPHVPGHELAGEVLAVGNDVDAGWVGRRVTLPFVAGCGRCGDCRQGHPQVCHQQHQPGFTGWGSYAELVAVRYANANLVELPEAIDSVTAASLGCRLATAYRAVAAQGRLRSGQWLAVHGCGGVGLSAVMLGRALGAAVLAVDIRDEPLALARRLGAVATLNTTGCDDVGAAVHELTGGGADVSLDAVGGRATFRNSVLSLRRRGRHVQVGLLAGADADPPAPMGRVIGWELELLGSHGLAAHAYPELLRMIECGRLDPKQLVERTITLQEAPAALAALDQAVGCGVTVITPQR
ncbi:alcohol dehydrogenase [Posidoniimonas polymericola]|uniref:Alcohol dehydrogenase n=1 Tax=Posidoniimonas polymericola TaxID=2528002 RepID=A0A5C5YRR4_9BACT|nr:zinc-dependent alcohol dehydrogenase family protein [Posidoniimonas polymericola]TWT77664.1 alcohol dehydrogenase [Posidoniimonas polymericola]